MNKYIVLGLSLLSTIALHAADTERNTVLSLELDGVARTNKPLGAFDFTGVASPMLILRARSLIRQSVINDLKNSFREIERSTHGIANVFYGLIGCIKERYDVDISDYSATLVDCFAHPQVDESVVDALRKIKERDGSTIVGATHFDAAHFHADRAKWPEGLDDQLDAYVVSRFNHNHRSAYADGSYTQEGDVYMVNAADAVTPKQAVKEWPIKTKAYFNVVQDVGHELKPSADRIVHFDPSQECVDNAKSAGLNGALYQQPADFATALGSKDTE